MPREEVFVITKLYPSQFSDAEAAIDEAMEKLDIGYIDLMLLHHPGDGDVEAYHAMEQAGGRREDPLHRPVQLVHRGAGGVPAPR